MAAAYDLDDDSVVVVIGSGAGGGTLGNELAQKGVDVVCLEAGPRLTLADIVNDFGVMFGRLSWLDRRIGSGATKVYERGPFPSGHNMGTCRMSANARDGVVNAWGQTHHVPNLFISDGSQFTTGAAENPTPTIVALAIRQAEYIADQMSRGEV